MREPTGNLVSRLVVGWLAARIVAGAVFSVALSGEWRKLSRNRKHKRVELKADSGKWESSNRRHRVTENLSLLRAVEAAAAAAAVIVLVVRTLLH